MYHIYFDHRRLSVCTPEQRRVSDPNAVVFLAGDGKKISELAKMFDRNDAISRLYIPSADPLKTYRLICSSFSQVNAAGGVVKNDSGEILMIFRNGKWDLPKGKQERNEDIRCTAVREVCEECGIKSPEIGKQICITDHTYHRDGKFILKHTYWYEMRYSGKGEFLPQQEEGITEVKWVSIDQIKEHLEDTYPSIRDVFEELLLEHRL